MLTLNEFRMIVQDNMPYDTGYMFLNGARFFETDSYLLCKYDINRVPYIVYNEEGTIYTQKNKGFIKQKTVGALMQYAYYKSNNMRAPFNTLNERIKRRASTDMIKQGALDKIRSEVR